MASLRAPDRPLRWLPGASAIVVSVATIPLGLSRDFLAFAITGLIAIPVLILTIAGFLFWRNVTMNPDCKKSLLSAAVVIVFTAPTVYLTCHAYRDQIVFAFWSPTHVALLHRYATRDGIISVWDGWGFAGMENDSYLIADNGKTLSSANEATEWVKRWKSPCVIVELLEIRRGLFIFTTANCGLDQ